MKKTATRADASRLSRIAACLSPAFAGTGTVVHNTESFFDFRERMSASFAGGLASAGEAPPRAAADAAPDYLESGRKHCENSNDNQTENEKKRNEEVRFEVASCGCRSRFCPKCCVGLGLTLRERLLPMLEKFKGLQMWTFTVDPRLFDSPESAFDYVREHRCISNVMRELKRKQFVHSDRYFVVVEWQMGEGEEEGTQMAHWHMLSDASFIPFDTVCELWNRYRPSWAGPVEGNRPGFGSVRFSAPDFSTPKYAANYACAYLIKHPKKGYPDWVQDRGDIHRYSTSRGFWATEPQPTEPEPQDSDGSGCVASDEASNVEEPAKRTTIRERLAKCGGECVVLKVTDCADGETGEWSERREFCCQLKASLKKLADLLTLPWIDGTRRLKDLNRAALMKMLQFRKKSGH